MSATSEVDLSVIIVSHNTRDLLRRCLLSIDLSLADQTITYEVRVVDNASNDGSPEMVASDFPTADLIANPENRGFAAANNQAIAQSQGRCVLLLNPDTEALDNAIPTLIRFADQQPRAGIVGGQLLYSDGSFQHSAFHFPTLAMSFLDLFPLGHRLDDSRCNGRYPRSRYRDSFLADHPLGACMLIRREVLDQIGILDEGFFIYCEEVDYCRRAKNAGWQVFCCPEAGLIHHGAQSTGQRRPEMLVELYRSRFYYHAKHRSPVWQWLNRRIVRLGMRAETGRILGRLKQGELQQDEAEQMLIACASIGRM